MKRVYLCLSGLFLAIAIFSVCFTIGYENSKEKRNLAYLEQEKDPKDSITVDTAKQPKVNSQMKYVLETVDSDTNTTDTKTLSVPSEFIGMTREELASHLKQQVEQPSFIEQRKGLLSYEVLSFSEKELKVRKTYSRQLVDTSFFVKDKEGQVTVYYGDKDTVFDYTGILTSECSLEDQVKLKVGFLVSSEEELYAVLESYSS